MAASSTRRSSGPVIRSLSPTGRFYSGSTGVSASASAFASSTSSSFTSRFLHRSASPTRLNLYPSGSVQSALVRFSVDRPISPNRSISAHPVQRRPPPATGHKKTCMCSPTIHPGSFRCNLHKNMSPSRPPAGPYQSNRLYARRSAMTNSLVRIGTVEGDLVKRALAALIRPSSHHQRRRADFQPRPSRLSTMSRSEDFL